MLSENTRKAYIELIKQEVKPALGCTEPIAVALAATRSREELGAMPDKVNIEVSSNILKNGMGVGIPGTGMIGLDIAAALGLVCGNSTNGLEVLKGVEDEDVEAAKELIFENIIHITVADTQEKLYIKATCFKGDQSASTTIVTMHDNIVLVEKNGEILLDKTNQSSTDSDNSESIKDTKSYDLTLKSIYEFATTTPYLDIKFILESAKLNRRLAAEGLTYKYGLRVGRSIRENMDRNVFGNGLMTYSMSLTAAASDARMAGCTLPAMSNSGSGNQGITVTLPVVAASEKLNCTLEQLTRALILSHLTAIHIKSHLGRLSALCGCVVASTGSSCGIVYLMGGNYEQVCYSIKNMVGNITGMICDGAKVGCALKVSTGVSCAVQSAVLAMNNTCISDNDGIIESDIERTIANLGKVGSIGMQMTDTVMLDIMVNKEKGVPQCY